MYFDFIEFLVFKHFLEKMDDLGLKKIENNNYEVEENLENNNDNPVMVLTIDIGNGKIEQFKLYNFENPKKDIYEFCMKNNLDYNTMEEITNQLNELIAKKVNEEEINNKNERNKFLFPNNNSKEGNSYINKLKKRNNNFSRDKFSNKKNVIRQSRDNTISNKKERSNDSKNLFPYQLDSKQNLNYNITIFHKIPNSKSLKKTSIKNKKINPKILEYNIFKDNKLPINNNNSNLNLSEAEILLNSEIIRINKQQYGLSNLNNLEDNNRTTLSNNKIISKKNNHNSLEASIKAGINLYNRGLKYQESGEKKLDKLRSSISEVEGKTNTFTIANMIK